MDEICYICCNSKNINSGLVLPTKNEMAFVCWKCINRMSQIELQNRGLKVDNIPKFQFRKNKRW